MEPKLPAPNSPESGAYNPQELPPRPEFAAQPRIESAPERPAQQELQPAGPAQAGPALPAPAVPIQPAASQVTPVLNPIPLQDNGPAAANDDEVIEKEWVDKAKKIVAETKDDPYRQEQEVSKLQANYLKKRYGKDIKLAGD